VSSEPTGFPSRMQIAQRMARLVEEAQRVPREWPPGDTMRTLVEDLLAKPACERRDTLVATARLGTFDCYRSTLAMPKVALINGLIAFGYDDLALKTIEGAYDDERPSPEQVEVMRGRAGAEFFDRVIDPVGASKRGKA